MGSSLCFNSRTLGRVRPFYPSYKSFGNKFQFTHPGKGATEFAVNEYPSPVFQFTHPGKGATSACWRCSTASSCFNSRTLGRVRPQLVHSLSVDIHVSIHAPWEGCDSQALRRCSGHSRFNSRTLGRVRRIFKARHRWRGRVSIHAPWEGCDRWR